MSIFRRYGARRSVGDHFEPNDGGDPQSQRHLRGALEQIDFTAYDANRKVLTETLGGVDVQKFERVAMAAAHARGRWVAAALAITEAAQPPGPDQVGRLAALRMTYEELTEVYDAMRRMVERGYLTYSTPRPE